MTAPGNFPQVRPAMTLSDAVADVRARLARAARRPGAPPVPHQTREIADRALRRMYPELGRRRLHLSPSGAVWQIVSEFIARTEGDIAAARVLEASTLVWGHVNDHPVFVLRSHARELATVNAILNTAESWGEVVSSLPEPFASRARDIAAEYGDGGDDGEDDWEAEEEEEEEEAGAKSPVAQQTSEEELEPEHWREMLAESMFPGWLEQEMLEWVPEPIQQSLGEVEASMLNGHCLVLYGTPLELITAFEGWGYRCVEDQLLVARAAGYDV